MSRRARRTEPPERTEAHDLLDLLNFLSYVVVKAVLYGVFRLYFGTRVLGTIPPRGPIIIAPNHGSFLDALVLGAMCPRRVRFVMTDTYASNRFVRWFSRWGRVIYINEGRFNRRMFVATSQALEQDAVVGMFPEGWISSDGRLRRVQPGIMSLAAKTGVPIIPTAIRGTFRALPRDSWFPKPSRIEIRFGDPMRINEHKVRDRAGLRREADRLGAAIASLLQADQPGRSTTSWPSSSCDTGS